MKTCRKCRRELPLTMFCVNRKALDGLQGQCRGCTAAAHRAAVAADPRYVQRKRLKQRYNMTLEQYDALLEKQGGVCAICHQPDWRELSVDHDHRCCADDSSCGNCVRGLLCDACNRSIGRMKDDPVRLIAAALYLMEAHLGS